MCTPAEAKWRISGDIAEGYFEADYLEKLRKFLYFAPNPEPW
jgi:hypothetical protein